MRAAAPIDMQALSAAAEAFLADPTVGAWTFGPSHSLNLAAALAADGEARTLLGTPGLDREEKLRILKTAFLTALLRQRTLFN